MIQNHPETRKTHHHAVVVSAIQQHAYKGSADHSAHRRVDVDEDATPRLRTITGNYSFDHVAADFAFTII